MFISKCIHDQTPFDFFFQAEDGIRDPEMSRGLGDVYKRQVIYLFCVFKVFRFISTHEVIPPISGSNLKVMIQIS